MKASKNFKVLAAIAILAVSAYLFYYYKQKDKDHEYKAEVEGLPKKAAKKSGRRYTKLDAAGVSARVMRLLRALGNTPISEGDTLELVDGLLSLQRESLVAVYKVASQKLWKINGHDLIDTLEKNPLALRTEFLKTGVVLKKTIPGRYTGPLASTTPDTPTRQIYNKV